jgi:hypothetical protein
MIKDIKIYGLIDPNTNQIRYVGKTKYNVNTRLSNHMCDKAITYKTNWLKSLKGLKPEIIILDVVSEKDWIFWEQYWISQVSTWGFNLTNSTLGGEGHYGHKPSDETNKKRREKLLGSKRTIEQRKNISEGKKTYKFTELHLKNLSESHKGIRIENTENYSKAKYKKVNQLLNGVIVKTWNSLKEAAMFYNVHQSCISKCCSGIKKQIKGFKWEYYNEQ